MRSIIGLSLYVGRFNLAVRLHVCAKEHLCETSAVQNLSAKSPEQQLAAMADAIVAMGQNVNQFYKDVKYR